MLINIATLRSKPGAVARTPTRASRRALPQTFEDDSLSERDVPEL
jgi:hypothetical protein